LGLLLPKSLFSIKKNSLKKSFTFSEKFAKIAQDQTRTGGEGRGDSQTQPKGKGRSKGWYGKED